VAAPLSECGDGAVNAMQRWEHRRVIGGGGRQCQWCRFRGWTIGVVDCSGDFGHRRSSGVMEDRRWAAVRWCSEVASITSGRPVVGGAGGVTGARGGEEATDNSYSKADGPRQRGGDQITRLCSACVTSHALERPVFIAPFFS
jgi:hypothetical protein